MMGEIAAGLKIMIGMYNIMIAFLTEVYKNLIVVVLILIISDISL